MSAFLFPDYCILLFAKAPLPGQVKTRLQFALGADGALQLYRRLLSHAAATCAQARIAPTILFVDAANGEMEQLARDNGFDLAYQCEGDLGARMATAARDVLRTAKAVILVGTDCPWLDRDYLYAAAQQLSTVDAVIGPAADGGYVLLGLRKMDESLFRDIHWSSATVCAATRLRLQQLCWSWRELETLTDIDRPEDLVALRRHPAFSEG